MSSLEKKLESFGKAMAERESAKIYQFPLWGEVQRGVPNEIARSALFTARKGVGSEYLRDAPVFTQNGFSITYTGGVLTQDHLDIFEGIMHLAREVPEGNTIRFTAHGLLRLIGRKTSGRDHERLLRAMKDLTATAVTIKKEGIGTYCGSLLPEWGDRERDGMFSIRINRDLITRSSSFFSLTF